MPTAGVVLRTSDTLGAVRLASGSCRERLLSDRSPSVTILSVVTEYPKFTSCLVTYFDWLDQHPKCFLGKFSVSPGAGLYISGYVIAYMENDLASDFHEVIVI